VNQLKHFSDVLLPIETEQIINLPLATAPFHDELYVDAYLERARHFSPTGMIAGVNAGWVKKSNAFRPLLKFGKPMDVECFIVNLSARHL
jgi:hypothetical protein